MTDKIKEMMSELEFSYYSDGHGNNAELIQGKITVNGDICKVYESIKYQHDNLIKMKEIRK